MRWYGHVMRMEDQNPVKRTMCESVKGKRPRGRPRKEWKDNIKEDMCQFQVANEHVHNRQQWKAWTKAANPAI